MKGQISFTDEIMVDLFAGGGGTSTGFELATGRPVTIAVNHDKAAVKMHTMNHPFTEHYCENILEVDPEEACKGRPVGLLWLSPDCKHFSRAKGDKPVDNNIRGLAWMAVKWARKVKPRVIILENVPEFLTWGPLKNKRPDKKHMGETFKKFVRHLQKLGYKVEWNVLKACDYGAPTIRERLILIARCDGQPIIFPKATHGNKKGLLPYRSAAECIDWSIPCPSIFERKKPLVKNTMRRIARGLDKFTIKSDKPFIITCNHSGSGFRGQDINRPLNTITQKCSDGVVTPFIASFHFENKGTAADSPLSTITTVNTHYAVLPHLIQYHSETSKNEVRGQELNKPLMTLDTSPRYALSSAYIIKYYSRADQHTSVARPLPTITTKERHALLESHLCVLHNNMDCKPMTEPLNTLATTTHFAEIRTSIIKYVPGANLMHWPEVREILNEYCDYNLKDDELLLLEINNQHHFIGDIGMRMLEPRELYNAQGFPPDYIIDFEWKGKPYPKKHKVAKVGNSVPPKLAEAVIRANMPEWCCQEVTTMFDLRKLMCV